jgi:hypothetical protein
MLLYFVGLTNGLPSVIDGFDFVSISVTHGLHLDMLARSRISVVLVLRKNKAIRSMMN